MINKNEIRLRRARKTRSKIAELKSFRLSVHRSNSHIYAQVISPIGSIVIASASTLEPNVRAETANGSNVSAAKIVGKLIAKRAIIAGINSVSFDRSGFQYHGRVKALAEAAREEGLKF